MKEIIIKATLENTLLYDFSGTKVSKDKNFEKHCMENLPTSGLSPC